MRHDNRLPGAPETGTERLGHWPVAEQHLRAAAERVADIHEHLARDRCGMRGTASARRAELRGSPVSEPESAVDVTAFGADPSGERDSAEAIQAAIDALPGPSIPLPGARISVHGRPGDHPSRPLTSRGRMMLPTAQEAAVRAGGLDLAP